MKMTNDLKKIMEKEFDQDKNYQAILSKAKKKKRMKPIYFKYGMIPAFMLMIALVLMGIKEPRELTIGKENTTIELRINKIKDMALTQSDADVKTVEMKNLPEKLDFINHICIPKDMKMSDCYQVYVKENIQAKEYNILHDYVFIYEDQANEKNVQIALSEIDNPLRDYYLDSAGETSKINNTEVMIYQYENRYMVSFQYYNINFDIETNNIQQEELEKLLTSII